MKTPLKLSQASETVKNWVKPLGSEVLGRVPKKLRETVKLRAFGLMKIPVLFFVSPTVTEINSQRIQVKIPLNRRTRNHLNSMYFAVLAAGADCACGLLAMKVMDEKAPGRISLIFKDFKAEFLKRAEGDTVFSCEQGMEIADLVDQAIATGERQNLPVEVIATVPSRFGNEPVAKFVLTLSLKYQ